MYYTNECELQGKVLSFGDTVELGRNAFDIVRERDRLCVMQLEEYFDHFNRVFEEKLSRNSLGRDCGFKNFEGLHEHLSALNYSSCVEPQLFNINGSYPITESLEEMTRIVLYLMYLIESTKKLKETSEILFVD